MPRTITVPDSIGAAFDATVDRYCERIGDASDDSKHLAHIAIIQRGVRDLRRELDAVAPAPAKGRVA